MDSNNIITTELVNGRGRSSTLVVTFNTSVIGTAVFRELGQVLTNIERHQDDKDDGQRISGVIFTSSSPKIFLAGADLYFLDENKDSIMVLDAIIDIGHELFERIQKLKIPTVAAINGACLGGGYELALACDYRICSNDKSTKVGLPEVTLGLIPAWGGCTRLPTLLGTAGALEVILSGRQYPAKLAKKKGLIDDVFHKEHLTNAARDIIDGKRKYHRKFIPTYIPAWIANKIARRNVLKKTTGNYPAALRAIDTIKHSISTTRQYSYEREKQVFIQLIKTPETRNLLRIFFLQEKSKKLKINDFKAEKQNTTNAVVLGAGTMGAGIAQWLSSRGVNVLLKDVKTDLVANGLKKIGDLYVQGVQKHKMDRPAARDGLARISTATQDVDMRSKGIVIEAIVEKLDIKKTVLSQLEKKVGKDCIIATNTSALSINEMSSCLEHPERFVGIHFFNPVHRMKLVEVVKGEHTSDDVTQQAVKFVQSIGKLPVVVNDSPGFVVNRILIPYLLNAIDLTYDYDMEMVDEAMLRFGMPMGPFRLMDEIGLDICSHVAWDICNRLKIECAGMVLLEEYIKSGKLGKKTGEGFYDYTKKKKKRKKLKTPRDVIGIVTTQLSTIMSNEAKKVMDEGVIDDPDMLDFAMIMGTGWAPFRGGPLKSINYKL